MSVKIRKKWGLIFLGGGLGLVAFLMNQGIPDGLKKDAQQFVEHLEKSEVKLKEYSAELNELIASDRDYLAGQSEVKSAKILISQRESQLKKLQERTQKELQPILDADKERSKIKLGIILNDLRSQEKQLYKGLSKSQNTVRQLLSFKKNHKSLMKRALAQEQGVRRSLKRIEAPNTLLNPEQKSETGVGKSPTAGKEPKKSLPAGKEPEKLYLDSGGDLYQIQELAKTQCPQLSPKIEARLNTLEAHSNQLLKSSQLLKQKAKQTPIDYAACGRLALAIHQGSDKLAEMEKSFQKDLDALGQSEDKILIDMKEEGGTHHHKYRLINGSSSKDLDWQAVSPTIYRKHEEHLGMSLYSRPECSFPQDAVKVASPPGYNYVGNSRYGRWRGEGRNRFWEFYGRYAMMRSLFWGPSYYSPIYYGSWRSYRSSVGSGRPYYGSKKQYGTSGSHTKKRYSSSKYMKHKKSRFKSSKYSGSSKSKGYKGSKFSGSSRSSNRRSSRSSSSSYGGSGK